MSFPSEVSFLPSPSIPAVNTRKLTLSTLLPTSFATALTELIKLKSPWTNSYFPAGLSEVISSMTVLAPSRLRPTMMTCGELAPSLGEYLTKAVAIAAPIPVLSAFELRNECGGWTSCAASGDDDGTECRFPLFVIGCDCSKSRHR